MNGAVKSADGPRGQLCRWHAVCDEQALQQTAVEAILASAARAVHERGRFQIVLAGGNTPRAIYRGLCEAQTKWSAWHIYFGNERCLCVANCIFARAVREKRRVARICNQVAYRFAGSAGKTTVARTIDSIIGT